MQEAVLIFSFVYWHQGKVESHCSPISFKPGASPRCGLCLYCKCRLSARWNHTLVSQSKKWMNIACSNVSHGQVISTVKDHQQQVIDSSKKKHSTHHISFGPCVQDYSCDEMNNACAETPIIGNYFTKHYNMLLDCNLGYLVIKGMIEIQTYIPLLLSAKLKWQVNAKIIWKK